MTRTDPAFDETPEPTRIDRPPRLRPRRRVGLMAVAALLIVGAGFGIYTVANRQPKPAAAGAAPTAATAALRPALTVTTALPRQAEGALTLGANGSVAAWQEAIIGSEANGLRLTSVDANVGDVVRAGQVLATFSADTVKAELAQSKAAVLEAEATAADAAANAQRARTLEKSGALSAVQIATYATAEQTAKARVEAARAGYEAQQVRLGFAAVRAPDSGVISARNATVGAVVGAGSELFRMVRKGRLEFRAEVTSSEIGRIRPGMPVEVTAAGGAKLQGKVRTIAPTVDPQTRNGLVYVDLPAQAGYGMASKAGSGRTPVGSRGATARPAEPARGGLASALFLPGMFAHGDFILGQSSALTVPQQAVVVRDAFSYVFTVGADGHVAQRKVQTGRQLGDRVEIVNGLDAATPVVVQGAGFLNDHDLVRVVAPAEANTGAAGSASPSESSQQNMPPALAAQSQSATK